MFRQCRLEKTIGPQTLIRVSWIPEPFCKVGKRLRLRERGESWDQEWVVREVGEPRPEAPEYRHLMVTCPELR